MRSTSVSPWRLDVWPFPPGKAPYRTDDMERPPPPPRPSLLRIYFPAFRWEIGLLRIYFPAFSWELGPLGRLDFTTAYLHRIRILRRRRRMRHRCCNKREMRTRRFGSSAAILHTIASRGGYIDVRRLPFWRMIRQAVRRPTRPLPLRRGAWL